MSAIDKSLHSVFHIENSFGPDGGQSMVYTTHPLILQKTYKFDYLSIFHFWRVILNSIALKKYDWDFLFFYPGYLISVGFNSIKFKRNKNSSSNSNDQKNYVNLTKYNLNSYEKLDEKLCANSCISILNSIYFLQTFWKIFHAPKF